MYNVKAKLEKQPIGVKRKKHKDYLSPYLGVLEQPPCMCPSNCLTRLTAWGGWRLAYSPGWEHGVPSVNASFLIYKCPFVPWSTKIEITCV